VLYFVPGRGIVDEEEGNVPLPGELTLPSGEKITWGTPGTEQVASYVNPFQYGSAEPFQWSTRTGEQGWRAPERDAGPGYLPRLLDFADRIAAGTAQPYERDEYERARAAALAIPARDIATLTPYQSAGRDADPGSILSPQSPDLGAVMLGIRDRMQQGQATDQEQALFQQMMAQLTEQNWRANVPQPSDAFSLFGDNLMGALAVLGMGATGGMAAAPLFAGGASLATTLGSLGTLGGLAGTGASVVGGATGQDWLAKLGMGLGIAGGLAGGIGGLTNVLGSGVSSLGDAARLASSAGKVTGALGRIPGADPLKQASSYLGLAGGLGQAGSGVQGLLGAAQGVQQGATQAATQALTDTGGRMADDWGSTDWLGWSGGGQGPLLSDAGAGLDWGSFTSGGPGSFAGQWLTDTANGGVGSLSLEDQVRQAIAGRPDLYGSASTPGNWLTTALGSLGSFLGKNAGLLGPAASALGSLGGGAIGSNASSDAARLQAAAINRGLDLQTAQWLQQQANQAPWLQAGQQALPQLQQLAGQGPPGAFQPPPTISGVAYGLPSPTPGWTPQTYAGYTPGAVPQASQYGYQGPQAVQAGDYRWTPGQGPRAQDYRYTPGQTPDAAQYRYTPGAVPTLSGQELLANDPGVQFRLDRARNALEGSAAARGSALSGPALAALQEQGQDLASQEYGNAWQRAAQQAQMREGWAQQATAQNFGQAMSAAQLREQLQQVATQQGWSQAQTEAVFREQMAQQASQQGFGQALQGQQQQWQQGMAGQQFDWSRAIQEAQQREQGQQFGWQAGFQGQQQGQRERQAYDTDLYNRMMGQSTLRYGQDVAQNQSDYERMLAQYNSQTQAQNTQWNRLASMAGYGQTAVGQLGTQGANYAQQQASLLGQLGNAQAGGTLGSGQSWMSALQNVGQSVQGGLANQQLLSVLQGLNR
jgi:hypothetical protein